MNADANLQLMILGAMFVFSWLTLRLVRYTKTRRINTELWCTVFEGLTQGAIRLDDLKVPEAVIEKKIRRDGKDRDPLDLTGIEAQLSRQIGGEQIASMSSGAEAATCVHADAAESRTGMSKCMTSSRTPSFE